MVARNCGTVQAQLTWRMRNVAGGSNFAMGGIRHDTASCRLHQASRPARASFSSPSATSHVKGEGVKAPMPRIGRTVISNGKSAA